jgi:hypothetical protein
MRDLRVRRPAGEIPVRWLDLAASRQPSLMHCG